MITHDCKRTCCSCEITNRKCSWISNLLDQDANIGLYVCGMQTPLDYCKVHSGKNNGHNLLRFSMVVDGIKESRIHMGSTGILLLFQNGSVWGWSGGGGGYSTQTGVQCSAQAQNLDPTGSKNFWKRGSKRSETRLW